MGVLLVWVWVMTNVSVSGGVTGPCSVCGRTFWGADEDKLRAAVIRHRITNDPPCDDAVLG